MRARKIKILLLFSLPVLATPIAASHAATFTRIYKFPLNLNTGQAPVGQLTLGADGSLYGATGAGGPEDNGTIFKITPQGHRITLYSFAAVGTGDGVEPNGGLVLDDAGNLYGTTREGGADGFGTVFKIAPNGTETLLHSFGVNGNMFDGEYPTSGLISDGEGNLYGMTPYGGGRDTHGTLFKITPSGTLTILYYFNTTHKSGFEPLGRLVLDKSGALYGTTGDGGTYGLGTIFKFSSTGMYETLYNFGASGTDGKYPYSGLVPGRSGVLYGTTSSGGQNNLGTIYSVDQTGSEKVIFNFSGVTGQNPRTELVADAKGVLYGTTATGGTHSDGVVFKVTPSGKEAVLHSFKGPDGSEPAGALVFDASGDLYGSTTGDAQPTVTYGTVFKITP